MQQSFGDAAVLVSANDGDVLILKTGPVSALRANFMLQPVRDWFTKHDKDVLVIILEDTTPGVVLATDGLAAEIRSLLEGAVDA